MDCLARQSSKGFAPPDGCLLNHDPLCAIDDANEELMPFVDVDVEDEIDKEAERANLDIDYMLVEVDKWAEKARFKKKKPKPPKSATIGDEACDLLSSDEEALAPEFERRSGKVKLAGVDIGRISYMLQWMPMSTSCKCFVHPECSISGELSCVQEEDLIDWLAMAASCDSAEEHCNLRPDNTYNKRHRRTNC